MRAPDAALGQWADDGLADSELLRRMHAGEHAAAAAIYDRYADRLHDFCWSLLRDRDRAAEVAELAFVAAMDQLRQVVDMEPLRPWLYAVAHRHVIDRLRADRASDDGVAEESADLLSAGEEMTAAAEQAAEREVVWRGAAGLSERDQALLTLHLRHGLDEAELSQAIGVELEQARVLVSRLRDQVERSLGALLVGRRGRRDCPELAKLLSETESRFALVRKRVTRHVDRCGVCAERRGRANPLALLAAVPAMPAPPESRERVLGQVVLEADLVAAPRRRRPSWRMVRLLAAATLALAATGAIVFGQRDRPETGSGVGQPSALGTGPTRPTSAAGSASTTSAPAASTTTSSTSSTTSTTVVVSAAALAVSPAAVALGARDQNAAVTVRNSGAVAVRWQAGSSASWLGVAPGSGSLSPGASAQLTLTANRSGLPEGTAQATATLSAAAASQRVAVTAAVERAPAVQAAASPTRIRTVSLCGPTTARVTATVSDESALGGVVLEWGNPVTRTPMSQRDGTWQAALGPVGRAQTLAWRVVATDSHGNAGVASGTVRVDSCLLLG